MEQINEKQKMVNDKILEYNSLNFHCNKTTKTNNFKAPVDTYNEKNPAFYDSCISCNKGYDPLVEDNIRLSKDVFSKNKSHDFLFDLAEKHSHDNEVLANLNKKSIQHLVSVDEKFKFNNNSRLY